MSLGKAGSRSKRSGFFLVKKDNIYAKLENILAGEASTNEQIKEFLKAYHIHIDPLGFIQFIRTKLVNEEVANKEIVHELLIYWVDTFPYDFAGESKRIDLVKDLLLFLESPVASEYKSKLRKILKKDPLFKPNRASLSTFAVISQHGTETIAKEIATHCRNLFEQIPDNGFKNEKWRGNPDSPVNVLFGYTASVSGWVASSVISKGDRKTQAASLATFCEMLFHIYKTRNYTALFSVLKGLNKVSVQRMSSVWKTLPSKSAANYELVDSLFNPGNDFERYRRKLDSSIASKKDCFPCFEIFVSDIAGIQELEDKSTLVANVKRLYPTKPLNDEISGFIANLPCFSDDMLLELSLNLYKPDLADAQTMISEKNSFLFTYDKLTPTNSDTSTTQTSSEWDINTYIQTAPAPQEKKKKSMFSGRTGLGGLYSRQAPAAAKPSLKVGSVNKYGYTLLCKFTDLKPEKGLKIKVSKNQLAVFLVNSTVHVIDNKCIHQDVPLAPGDIEEYKGEPSVVCPGHGLKFGLITGACNVKRYTQRVYPAKVKGEVVWAKLK